MLSCCRARAEAAVQPNTLGSTVLNFFRGGDRGKAAMQSPAGREGGREKWGTWRVVQEVAWPREGVDPGCH